jgi:hypothetical protein
MDRGVSASIAEVEIHTDRLGLKHKQFDRYICIVTIVTMDGRESRPTLSGHRQGGAPAGISVRSGLIAAIKKDQGVLSAETRGCPSGHSSKAIC